ncbi:MAG: tetratricopeptide repeat protein [Nitrospirae bacterium]|nr:MAG: tetratricopeptide repeat protein [Nitrospirota bacterium]
MPKPIKKKVVKKAGSEIEVGGVISKLKESAAKKKRVMVAAAGAVLIFAGAVSGFFIYNGIMKNKAQKLEYEAYKMYYGLYLTQSVAGEEQYKKALELFKQAYDAKKSPVSLFYIANCYYETGRYEEALNTLGELNRKFPDDERFVPLSYYKMAMVSLKRGENEEALKALDILYRYKTGTYKDLSLLESGRILEAMGKADDAKRKYEELTKNFPQSPFAEEAQIRAGEKKS